MSALEGVRIVDLSAIVSGPFATMLLGDLGADVIKVEPPEGDGSRRYGPPFVAGESPYYLSVNRNKRSLRLDLRRPEGVEVARRLAAGADVVVSNFRPGVRDRLGLGYRELAKANPALIDCQITGFGPDGPWADRPAFDMIVQGMSGLMSVTGSPESGPFRAGIPIMDLAASLFGTYGILAALYHRSRTGEGQLVQVSMLESALALLTYQASRYLLTGEDPPLDGNRHAMTAPYGLFLAADGPLNICSGSEAIWMRLCRALGRPDLARDPRFATNPDRVRQRDELGAEIERILAAAPVREWVERLSSAGVPCGPVLTVGQALSHPQTEACGVVTELEHPTIGRLRAVRTPVSLSGTPASVRRPPPLLDEHGEEILAELGYTPADIERLTAAGVG